jgi:hypothetical protein
MPVTFVDNASTEAVERESFVTNVDWIVEISYFKSLISVYNDESLVVTSLLVA